MPFNDIDKQREWQREYQRRRRSTRLEQGRILRKKVIDLFGGKCVYCGCDIFEVLEINHKNGGGNAERRKSGSWQGGNGYLREFLNGTRNKDDYELTCRICNAWHYLVKIKGIPDRWKITFI